MFDKRDMREFGLLAVVVLVLNLVFWLALAAGVLYLLRSFGVFS
jgi:hypothetical protein